MKLKKYLIIFALLLIPLNVLAKTCENDKIVINSIELIEKSDCVTENSSSSISNMNVGFNLSFSDVGFAKYRIDLSNKSSNDYEFDNSVISYNYINYSISSDDGSNVIKANSSKSFYITVNSNSIPINEYKVSNYDASKKLTINLLSGSADNPKSNSTLYLSIVIAIIIICVITFIFIKA